MGPFLVYILKSSLCLVAFYLFYKVLLSRETFYRFNRFALLSLMAFAAVLPLVQIPLYQPSEVGQTLAYVEDWLVEVVSVEQVSKPVLTWPQALALLYLIGVVFFIMRHVYSVSRLLQLLRKGRREDAVRYLSDAQGIKLIVVADGLAPFSWMRYIVIGEKDLRENAREILLHERAHIRHHHSIDLLVAEVCLFFQWFNPAAWLLKQELQTIHEYEADGDVLLSGIDARHYQLLLIKKAVGTRLYSMANSLNHSNLKKRITMMMKRKSNPWARLKYAYVLPLAAIAVAAFARPEVQNASSEISAVKVNDLVGNLVTNLEEKFTLPDSNVPLPPDSIYEIVEIMPVFTGGAAGMMKFLSDNIKYPAEAQEAGIEGRVFTRFVINEDGSVSDVEILRSVHPLLDAEAIRVVKAMPKWTPGKVGGKAVKVRYSLPLVFRLQGESTPQNNTPVANKIGKDGIYEIVDTPPIYPGGEAALLKFISDNIKYPEEAFKAGTQGRVTTIFIINEDGSVSDVDVVRSVHPLLDAEAVRVVSSMPKWTPGKAGGKAVKVRFTMPVTFRLQGGESTSQTNAPVAKLSKTPEYIGGDKALYTFLAQNMKYPAEAQDAGVQGRAVVELTIAADGSMVNPHVTSSVHPLLEKEALRVVSMLQRWNPAVNENGQAVSATITLPISFFVADADGNIAQRDKSVEAGNEIIVVGQNKS
ncbi:MAG: M56 family metallopeptidase [Bacteroidaceae bacterium]|nr:M56 family metallopeptidase [Bacteroidaceae bacterium]